MDHKNSNLHTIGHSNLGLDQFIGMLERRGIGRVVDVRSTPYSRHVPHFGRERLAASLERVNIGYTHLGDALGGRPAGSGFYDPSGYVRYDLVARDAGFQSAITDVIRMGAEDRVALMCTEGDPLRCHRTLLVAQEISRKGMAVNHLTGPDRSERHCELISRLLVREGLTQPGRVGNRKELIEQAVRAQSARVAYRRRD